nr:DMT family transporter [Paenibacillus solani]
MIVVGIKDRSFTRIKNPIKQKAPWWVWLGGILGGIFVVNFLI